MTAREVCCPICWAMPDQDCRSDGLTLLIAVAGEPGVVHRERAELAVWISAPLAEWPKAMGYRQDPEPKILNHPEFEHGRRDAVANRPRSPSGGWKTIKSHSYSTGYAVGLHQRHSLCPMPRNNPDGIGVELTALLADELARANGDRNIAALHYPHGSYIAGQQFRYVAKYLPLVPLNDPPPPPDRTWQPGLFASVRD